MSTDTDPTTITTGVDPTDAAGADVDVGAGLDGDLDAVPLPRLEAHICAWAGRLAAATCTWLLALAVFDRREGWAGVGIRSCAHWLSRRCGISTRTGYDHLRVAHALERLPALRHAFAAGRLSYSKVRAIARVAEPDTDEEWVRQALSCTAGQLDRLVAAYDRLHPADEQDAERRHDRRRLTWRWDDDGMLVAHVVLSPEDGAMFVKAIDAARASLDDTSPVPDADPEAGEDAEGEGSGEGAADGQGTAEAGAKRPAPAARRPRAADPPRPHDRPRPP
jgi:hypothetical protein